MEWYLAVLKKYADFTGRARRTEYWMFVLCNVIISFVLGFLSRVPAIGNLFAVLAGLYALAVLIPGLAVSARRLHDTGKSGLLLLLALIPVVGEIILLVFFCTDSQPGPNAYGEFPK